MSLMQECQWKGSIISYCTTYIILALDVQQFNIRLRNHDEILYSI